MMRCTVERYVAQHRAMGYKFKIQNSLLTNFARFADERNDLCIKTDTVLEWAKQAPSPAQKTNRLQTVRRFAIAQHAENSEHQIPPLNAFGKYVYRRRKPYIYSEAEISALIDAASKLTPIGSVRPQTFMTLITLLYVSGLRISEALALNTADITDDGLVIRATKFSKSRLVPIHATTRDGIDRYLLNSCRVAIVKDEAVFVSLLGTRLAYSTAFSTFLLLLRTTGILDAPGNPGPCLHDLRYHNLNNILTIFISY